MNISYNLEACIVTFLEVKESGEPQFMKKRFKQEARAKQFIFDLMNSSRKVANVQFKINYNVKKEETI